MTPGTSATDRATFNGTIGTANPNLTANTTIGAITFATGNFTLSSTDATTALTLLGTTTNSTSAAINNTAGNNIISAPIIFGNATAGQGINSVAGNLTFSGGITKLGGNLTISGAGATIVSGGMTIGGSVLLANTGSVRLSGNNSVTNGWTLNGAGQLVLDSAAALGSSGAINFNAGILVATANNTTDYSSRFTVASGGNYWLAAQSGVTLTVASALVGNGTSGLKVGFSSNNGTIVLGTASNGFTGSASLNGGTLSVAGIGNAGTNSYLGTNGTILIGSGTVSSTLLYTGAGETTDKIINLAGTTGGATITNNSSGTLIFTSNTTATGVGNKTLTLRGSGTGEFAGSIVDNSATNRTSLTKADSGTWTLSGNNTYTGTTTLGSSNGTDAGTLRLIGSSSISSAATTIFAGTLDLNGTNQTITTLAMGGGASGSTSAISTGSGTLTLGGNVTYSATNNPGNATIAGNLNLGGAARTFTVGNSTGNSGGVDMLVSANLTNDGGFGLTKSGAGVLELSGVNSYTGNTTISGIGGLRVSSIGNQGQNSAVGAGSIIELVNSTPLVYTGSGDVTNRIISSNVNTNSQSPTLNQSGTGLLKFTNDLALSGSNARTLVLTGSTSGTGEFAGNIGNFAGNNTSVTKNGDGTWTLSGTNTYTGSTFINSGVLIVGSANGISGGLGASGGTSQIDIKGGILGLTEASGNLTRSVGNSNSTIRLSNSVATRGFAAFGVNRSVRFGNNAATSVNLGASGGGDLNGGLVLSHSTADATLNFENGLGLVVGATRSITVNNGSVAIDAIISGNITTSSGNWTTASILQINGDGTLALTGSANTFGNGSVAGQTFLAINQATLQIGNNGTTGMIGSGANATVQGDIQNDGVLAFALTSNPTLANVIKGNGSVLNFSTGRITLNGTNAYTGNTTVSAGTLALGAGGSIANSSLITVVSGATLDIASAPGGFVLGASQTLTGSGSVVGSATINGNLRPGSSPGVLSFSSDLTLGSGANLQMEINGNGTRGTTYDGINVAGALTYGGSLELVIDSPFAQGDYTFDLFSGFSGKTGNFTSVSLSGAYAGSFLRTGEVWELTSSGNTWTLNQLSGDLTVSAVPEPSTWAFLALAAGTFLLTRARRRKKVSPSP